MSNPLKPLIDTLAQEKLRATFRTAGVCIGQERPAREAVRTKLPSGKQERFCKNLAVETEELWAA
jgi:hypothetical protein